MTLRASHSYWILLAFVAIAFLMGGGARGDVQSLILLRPIAVLACVIALWGFTRQEAQDWRVLLGFAALCGALVLVQLLPMPHALWSALPGRELVDEAGVAAGLSSPWRPISLAPFRTWNSLFALLVPLAALLLAIRCTREERFLLLSALLTLGLLSGLLGLLQAIGPVKGPLYLYRITNYGSAVGLFANRNHQAALLACLFPMLAVFASSAVSVEQARLKGWLAIGAGAVIVPLLLVTGSRAGLVLGLLGLASVPLLYGRPQFDKPAKRKVRRLDPRYVLAGAAALGLGLLTVLLSRARAFERLASGDEVENLRFAIWGPISEMFWKYFPIGSGFGTFVEVYEVDEPYALMAPSYVNHAHNDWLELALTGGFSAILLLLLATVAWAWAFRHILRKPVAGREMRFARLGGIVIGLLGIASLVDYPLRVPSLAVLFVIAAVWLAGGVRASLAPRDANRKEVAVDPPVS